MLSAYNLHVLLGTGASSFRSLLMMSFLPFAGPFSISTCRWGRAPMAISLNIFSQRHHTAIRHPSCSSRLLLMWHVQPDHRDTAPTTLPNTAEAFSVARRRSAAFLVKVHIFLLWPGFRWSGRHSLREISVWQYMNGRKATEACTTQAKMERVGLAPGFYQFTKFAHVWLRSLWLTCLLSTASSLTSWCRALAQGRHFTATKGSLLVICTQMPVRMEFDRAWVAT